MRQKVSIVALSLVLLATGFDYGWKGKRMSGERYPFFFGQKSFKEVYEGWIPESCLAVRSLLGERKVALLNFFPGCYSLPGIQFERPLMNSYVKDYDQVMFGGALEAKETFRRYGVDHFLVDLTSQFHLTAFSPLFHPENIKKYFKILWQADGAYLLTWREAKDVEIEGSFLNSYATKYKWESQSPAAKVHERIRTLYKAKAWLNPRFHK